jgi:putative transposase
VHDAVERGRAIRVLRVLETIVAERGVPLAIRCDNGPKLTSRHFLAWCMDQKIELVHIEPGRPMQNGRVVSFKGRMREECLLVSWFGNSTCGWKPTRFAN